MSLNITPYATRSGMNKAISANEGGFSVAIKYIQVGRGKQAVFPEDDGCANVEKLKAPVGYVEILRADRVTPYQWQLVIDLVGLLDTDWNFSEFAACDANKEVVAIYGHADYAIYPVTRALDNALLAVNFVVGVFPADSIVIEHHNLPLEMFNADLYHAVDVLAATSVNHSLALDDHRSKLLDQAEKIASVTAGQQDTADKLAITTARLQQAELVIHSQELALRRTWEEEYNSGLVSVRMHNTGDDGYQTWWGTDVVADSWGREHNHPNYGYSATSDKSGVLGTAEWRVKLHGVLFEVRHIDNSIVKPVINGKLFQTTTIKPRPLPAALKAMIDEGRINDAIAELHQWFVALANQDKNLRPYHKYSTAVMTVMEGFDLDARLTEDSLSFRHRAEESDPEAIALISDLYSGTGAKTQFENKNHPLFGIRRDANGNSVMYKTEWRMFAVELGLLADYDPDECLYFDFDPVVADRFGHDYYQANASASAMFGVKHYKAADGIIPDAKLSRPVMLDDWMRKVPGLSNGRQIEFGIVEPKSRFVMKDPWDLSQPLDAGWAFRFYGMPRDAVGQLRKRLGWSDTTAWIALNERPEIVPRIDPYTGNGYRHSSLLPVDFLVEGFWNSTECNIFNIPWKPLNEIRGNGTEANPYNGYNENGYMHLLPADAFGIGSTGSSADTGGGVIWVLDSQGNKRRVLSSGFQMFTNPVNGKRARLRYPIMPSAHRGNPIFQNLLSDRRRYQRESLAAASLSVKQTLMLDDMAAKMAAQFAAMRGYVDGLHADNQQQELLLAANAVDLSVQLDKLR